MQLTFYQLAGRVSSLPKFLPMTADMLEGICWGEISRVTLPAYDIITVRADERKLNKSLFNVAVAEKVAVLEATRDGMSLEEQDIYRATYKDKVKKLKREVKLELLSKTLPVPTFYTITVNRKSLLMFIEGGRHDFIIDNIHVQLQEHEIIPENFNDVFNGEAKAFISNIELHMGFNVLSATDFSSVDSDDGRIRKISFNLPSVGSFTIDSSKTNQMSATLFTAVGGIEDEYEDAKKIEKASKIEEIIAFLKPL